MPETAIVAAADALLRVVVERERKYLDPKTIHPRSAPDLAGLASDPIGTACRAELRRLGEMIHAAGGVDALDEALISVAEMQAAHAQWRWMVLESAWTDIGRAAA